jgi:hypothetical protein
MTRPQDPTDKSGGAHAPAGESPAPVAPSPAGGGRLSEEDVETLIRLRYSHEPLTDEQFALAQRAWGALAEEVRELRALFETDEMARVLGGVQRENAELRATVESLRGTLLLACGFIEAQASLGVRGAETLAPILRAELGRKDGGR